MRLLIPKGSAISGQDVEELIQVYYKIKETNTYWLNNVADANRYYDVVKIGEVGNKGFCYEYVYEPETGGLQYDIRHSPDSITLGEMQW